MAPTWLITSLVGIVVAKLYFRGGRCTKRKNLEGKVAVVTGGNTGIGKETALDLAKNKCKVVIGARDKHKGQAAVDEIIKASGNKDVEFIAMDLGNLPSIDFFAKKVQEKYSKVDFLVNNAGVMMLPEKELTH